MRRTANRYRAEVPIEGKDAIGPDDLVTKRQQDNLENDFLTGSNTYSGDNTYSGTNTHSGQEIFSHATGVTTDALTERTEGEGITVSGAGLKASGAFAGFFPTDSQQELSGAGAIGLGSFYTAWTTTASDAGTIADGTFSGQLKKIKLIVDGGDGTLTGTGFTSIVFDDAGDYVLLMWTGAAWKPLENFGCTIT